MNVKLKDIAALAGVSVTTASYVVNGEAPARRISAQTAARVMAVAARHQWHPDAGAAALRRGHTRTIGFIIPDIENTSYARLAKRLDAGARAHGYQLLVASSEDRSDNERDLVAAFRARRCDGLIVASCLAYDDPLYRDCLAAGLPVVAIDRQLDPAHFVSFVSDDEAACRLLAGTLIEPSLTHVVYLGAHAALPVSQARRRGFRSALRATACRSTVRHAAAFTRQDGQREMARILSDSNTLPDAVLTSAYILLTGVLDALTTHDASWPRHTRLATFGDAQLLDYLPVPVDTVSQQHAPLSQQALDALIRMMGGEAVEPGVRTVPRLLKRRRTV